MVQNFLPRSWANDSDYEVPAGLHPARLKHIERHATAGDRKVLKKIVTLARELEEHPATGTGHVEQLRYELSGRWSRRINREHRLLYDIHEENKTVHIFSLWGHY